MIKTEYQVVKADQLQKDAVMISAIDNELFPYFFIYKRDDGNYEVHSAVATCRTKVIIDDIRHISSISIDESQYVMRMKDNNTKKGRSFVFPKRSK